ncbi:carbohydrate kinase [Thermococci archaeon]|uniref:carbohydrate kinase family protein n=1 Tax=Palaeococcus sp. (in: euryarchaeotes) TaxID=2820298 RepID=UPI000F15576C|nr:carbohydrate kinase [Palaeococcus sp. (in: euryarchaeotes)]MCD6559092.1 carbohydrate kinase [Palaeococcus sp. (in: euryarchaeotes)]RLF88730.1 MAG: carbohydrate kinase [Thermococci archaeon]
MIFAIGEVLIDFIARDEGALKDVKSFEKHPGGAPANVLVGLSRLGVESALISKVGRDPFGAFLLERLEEEGVNTSYVALDGERHTGVVFVQLIGAKPEFILYDGVAYFNLKAEDVKPFSAELLHFGSVLFAREPSRSTLFEILEREKITKSYDVNIRLDLWRGREDDMLADIERALKLADIIKIGDGELEFLKENGIDIEGFDFKLLAVTRGGEGSELIHGGIEVKVPAYRVEPVDTTGAGDAYMAALLASLHHMGKIENLELSEGELYRIGRFANLIAALSTMKRGAWSVPKLEEVVLMREVRELYQRSRR